MIPAFIHARMPELHYGPGTARRIPELIRRFGERALVVTGGTSLDASGAWVAMAHGLQASGVHFSRIRIASEPSPAIVDNAAASARAEGVQVVVAIGGGSSLDAGKAISAMIPSSHSVREHLEGLPGSRPHSGKKSPFIAAPTTAGTGSESTKNAVLSEVGVDGFKRSIRHDNLVPDIAVLDPELMTSCSTDQTAASGMDAFTQLLEGYVSPKATPLTDAFAWEGMRLASRSLLHVCGEGAQDLDARGAMALAAYCSGFVLAHAGLGIVHGLAGPIGGRWPAPHGMVCGTLLAASVERNIAALRERDPSHPALARYAAVGGLLCGEDIDNATGCDRLVARLRGWTDRLPLRRLAAYGIEPIDCAALATGADMKQNPIILHEDEVSTLLTARL